MGSAARFGRWSAGRKRWGLWAGLLLLGMVSQGVARADLIRGHMLVEQEGCLVRLTVHYDWHEGAYELDSPDCRFTITRSGGWSEGEVEVFSGQAPIAEEKSEMVVFDAGTLEVFHVTCEPVEDWPPPGHWEYHGPSSWGEVDIPEECWGTAAGCRTTGPAEAAGWLVVLLLVIVGGLAEAAGRRRR